MSAPEAVFARGNLLQGIWRVADPKITLASAASLLVGTAAAAHDGPIAWGWLALTVLGIFFLEAAKNSSGELVDWDTGDDQAIAPSDRSPFSGGKRVLVDGLMTRGQAAAMALGFYLLGTGAGFAIVWVREPSVIWLGMAGVWIAFFYHAPPVRLSYRGLGEAGVALAYGPLIAAGTYLVQRGNLRSPALLPALPVGLLIAAFLVINEFPDHDADRLAGKRTLVVRLGKTAAADFFAGMLIAAYALLFALPLLGAPLGVLGGAIGVPLAVRAALRLREAPGVTPRIVPAQAWTLLSFVLCAVGVAAGLLLFR